MIDFKKLDRNQNGVQTDPRSIFMSLPKRLKQYEYPRDVQAEVWKQWYDIRDNKECIIKMNTGSGKTVVGLMILKSCLNEEKGPAVYVVPDKFLVSQVCEEAKKLGISVTDDPEEYSFLRKQSILIINIWTLFNAKSKFGMRESGNINIGSIIIDDVHACLATIDSQCCISIPATSDMYDEFIELFSSSLKQQSETKYIDIVENQDIKNSMLIPYWNWQSKQTEVYRILSKNENNDYIKFKLQLIKDCLPLCNCMVSSRKIEISPICIPINKIVSFVNASRRIYMSATLPDDSPFVTALDVNEEDIKGIISPEKANDIGDRMIIFPQVINKFISDLDIKNKLKEISQDYNVVVIVPSERRADFWKDKANIILDSQNIKEGVSKLKSGHVGLAIIINKYDGIDLPGDACRLLVIDGLPNIRSEYDAYEQNANHKNRRICSEQIQKIEQGMGRGVRSNTDYCAVVLMGKSLADIIYTSGGLDFFSDATKEQFKLSEDIWEQLDEKSVEEIFSILEYVFKRDIDWMELSKERLATIKYSSIPNFDLKSTAIRKAFNCAENRDYQKSVEVLEGVKNDIDDIELKGLFKQYIASYTNFYNKAQAQQIQLSAHKDNRMLLLPIAGTQYEKVINKTGVQANYFIKFVTDKNLTANQYIIKINSLLEKLVFEPETSKKFEQSIEELSFLLGIYSNRPEDEYGKGPDNFWDLGNSAFLVIECKNGTITNTICKHDCNQLNGSINWFKSKYYSECCKCYPIMIHNSRTFEYACSPNMDIRIMTPDLLEKFKTNVLKFAENVVKPENYQNPVNVNSLLKQFNLLGSQIVDNYTTLFSINNK